MDIFNIIKENILDLYDKNCEITNYEEDKDCSYPFSQVKKIKKSNNNNNNDDEPDEEVLVLNDEQSQDYFSIITQHKLYIEHRKKEMKKDCLLYIIYFPYDLDFRYNVFNEVLQSVNILNVRSKMKLDKEVIIEMNHIFKPHNWKTCPYNTWEDYYQNKDFTEWEPIFYEEDYKWKKYEEDFLFVFFICYTEVGKKWYFKDNHLRYIFDYNATNEFFFHNSSDIPHGNIGQLVHFWFMENTPNDYIDVVDTVRYNYNCKIRTNVEEDFFSGSDYVEYDDIINDF